MKTSNLPLQLRVTRGKSLKDRFVRSALTPLKCVRGCHICNKAGQPADPVLGAHTYCKVKDIVYSASCNHCPNWYCGETSQTLGARSRSHLYNVQHGRTDASALAKHHHDTHPAFPPTFTFRSLGHGGGCVRRKCKEKVIVEEFDPGMNRNLRLQ